MPTSPCLITVLWTEAGETMVDLVNAITHMAEGGCSSRALQDTLGTCRGFFFFLAVIWVRTSFVLHLSHITLHKHTQKTTQKRERRHPLADNNQRRRWRPWTEEGSRGREEKEILPAAVTTAGAIYSSPINKAPTDSDTQADRGIIFIWYLAKAPLLKRLLSVNDKQLSFD